MTKISDMKLIIYKTKTMFISTIYIELTTLGKFIAQRDEQE